jgi:hypothetical protein
VAGALALFSLGLLIVFGQRKLASGTDAGAAAVSASGLESGVELQSRAVQEPKPAPLVSLNTVENSALEAAPEPAPSASNLPAAKKVGRPHNSLKAPLQKKGNERYGRFE